MRRATVTLTDDLESAIDAFINDQQATPSLNAVTQAALREYLAARGYLRTRKVLRITPADMGSDDPLVSAEHDRVFTETHK